MLLQYSSIYLPLINRATRGGTEAHSYSLSVL